jgi:SIR2-like domain
LFNQVQKAFGINQTIYQLMSTLHNDHNVYILGAGFSRLRGLPLISDFMTMMRDALPYHASLGHQNECKAIEAVLRFRLEASAAAYRIQIDLENIEELFSLASASISSMDESIKLAIGATIDFAYFTQSTKVAKFRFKKSENQINFGWSVFTDNFGGDDYCTAPAYQYITRALLGRWSDLSDPSENSFITFNYDTLLEEALGSMGIQCSLGFDEDKGDKESKNVPVYKVHGSVNWAIPKGARTKIEVFESYRDVINKGLVPQIIPPTWKKDSRGAFNEIWEGSLTALSNATRVVIIGFSMPPTDLHFKYLLAAGLKENYSLREIVFVNPVPGMALIKQRCENLFANQVHNAAKLRYADTDIQGFTGQGTFPTSVFSIGRSLPSSIQGVQFLPQ